MQTWYINLYRSEKELMHVSGYKRRVKRPVINKVHCATVRSDWKLIDWTDLVNKFPKCFMMNPDRHLMRRDIAEFGRFHFDNIRKFYSDMDEYCNKKGWHYDLTILPALISN